MTSHHLISSHRISPCNQPHYLTSPHNQPHFHISPHNHPHDIIPHHNTSHRHHRHTMETQPDTTKTPPDGTAEGWCAQKKWFGQRTGWWPYAHSIGKSLLWLLVFLFLKLPPPARPGTIGNLYQTIQIYQTRSCSETTT